MAKGAGHLQPPTHRGKLTKGRAGRAGAQTGRGPPEERAARVETTALPGPLRPDPGLDACGERRVPEGHRRDPWKAPTSNNTGSRWIPRWSTVGTSTPLI